LGMVIMEMCVLYVHRLAAYVLDWLCE
jgi:hypothetical protein